MPVATRLAGPGTYLLVVRSTDRRSVEVGRLGVLHLEPGYYAYAGSALGPGGLGARVGRHLRGRGRAHWHIDYLRAHAPPIEAWYCRGNSRFEHLWSEALRTRSDADIPLAGFGASDCRCASHLFFFTRRPSLADFRATLRRRGLPAGSLSRWLVGDPATMDRLDTPEAAL
ncbi:MAG: GIY-YIG nuclease family protein [Gemmatimonadales bacterium]|jgi:Uri superfamily endonuclease